MANLDQYALELTRQNEGGTCSHCGSSLGHFSHCPLICRATAEALSALNGDATEEDTLIAHALGHFSHRPLICRATAEALSALHGDATEEDTLIAHALGVAL